ncbi:MAG TPA: Txe/YoeB family addiction module toxin [Longimicrobium sp.]|nr:Txe/YoeB family addiction module toxin [Longimicrobium sp.]
MARRKKRQNTPAPAPIRPKREFVVHPEFWADLRHWIDTDAKLARRLMDLVEEIGRDPFGGRAKPEPLKYQSGAWARRLTSEHRVVYRVSADRIEFASARGHYPR